MKIYRMKSFFVCLWTIMLLNASLVLANESNRILVKFKEDVTPTEVLSGLGIVDYQLEFLHTRKPAVTNYLKDHEPQKNAKGEYLFEGNVYQQKSDIPEELIFRKAYAQMSSIEKGSYRIYLLTTSDKIDLNRLNNDPNIEYAERDQTVSIQ